MGDSIVVVGGGTIGLSVAESLSRRGASLTVVDRQALATEASWASSGFLDLRGATERGSDFFELCRWSFELYPEWAERIHAESGIDPEYVHSRSFDLVYDQEQHADVLALERRLDSFGVTGSWLSGDEARQLEPGISNEVGRAFQLEHPCQVRPTRLNRGLITALQGRGVGLMEHAAVLDFAVDGDRVGEVRTTRGTVSADHVILCSGPWSGLLAEKLEVSLPVRPIRGQALVVKSRPRSLERILFGTDGYLVPRVDGRIFIGSTIEDVGFVKGTTPSGLSKLTRLAIQTMPELASAPVEGSWSGLRPGSPDGRPFLGRLGRFENLWIASGHFTHGILLAPATADLLAQAIAGESTHVDLSAYSPSRSPPVDVELQRAPSF